ncbi:MAG TPA: hypothetical protein VGF99_13885, partial [Myxococcota bacterium]
MKRDGSTLLLVGAGELGSRHLQGLAVVAADEVLVVEPSPTARDRAAARYLEVASPASPLLRFVDDVAAVDARADVGIVATGSLHRRAVVEGLAGAGVLPRRLVLEKFLFP